MLGVPITKKSMIIQTTKDNSRKIYLKINNDYLNYNNNYSYMYNNLKRKIMSNNKKFGYLTHFL